MNQGNEHDWLDRPDFFSARPGTTGWSIRFAELRDGTRPALDYLMNNDLHSDPSFKVESQHLRTFKGVFQMVSVDGPVRTSQGKFFSIFKGDDAREGMCEVRVVTNLGHRMLGFLRPNQVVVFTNGFRKPAQEQTPPERKTRALNVLREHEARLAELNRRKEGRHRR